MITDIPIVGQPFAVIMWYPTCLVTCRCSPGVTILVLTGFGNHVKCPKCERLYVIEKLNERNELEVSMVIPMPGGGSVQ